MFLSLGGSRRSNARENNNNNYNSITTTQSHGCNALNQAGVDSSSRVALLDTLQRSTRIGSYVPPLAPASPDVTSSCLSLDPLQSLAGSRSRYAPFSRLGASPLPPYYYTHDLAMSQNYGPSFQSPDPLSSSLHGNTLLQPSLSSVSSSSSLVVPSFVSSSTGTSSPSIVKGSSLCRGDCSPGPSNNFAAHKPRVLQPSARRSQTLDLAKKLKDSLGTKFADSLRETLEGAAKPEPWVPECSDEESLLKSDGTTTGWKMYPHSLEDGSSSRSEGTGGFSGRESWDSGTHWGVEAISNVNPNSSPNPICSGSNLVFPEAAVPSARQHPRSNFELSDAEVSSWLQSQQNPQPQPSLAGPQVAQEFTSSAANHGPILSELSPQTYVWPQERHISSTTTTALLRTSPEFENSPLAHATSKSYVEDLLRLPSDSGSFSEVMNYGGQGGAGVKRFVCDDGGDVGVNTSKRQKLCASGLEVRADGTGAGSSTAFGFDQYLAALAATERVPSYELVPSPHELGAGSPVSKFLEHFDRHEEQF